MFRTASLTRGENERGYYGYRNRQREYCGFATQGPGTYTPYAQINTPTHRMVSARYFPDRERSRDVLHARDMEPMFLSLTTLERNQPILPQGRPKKPDKALELMPKERLVDDGVYLTLPRSTWCRCPVRSEEITRRPQEDRERYLRVHARSTPLLLGMRDLGKQTHTKLSTSVLGSQSLEFGETLRASVPVKHDWGGAVTTDSVNTRALRAHPRTGWGGGFGHQMAEGSLDWFRYKDEHTKRYVLETTREKQINAFESQHKDPDSP